MSVRYKPPCRDARYFLAKCGDCGMVHMHCVVCKRHRECWYCHGVYVEALTKVYQPPIEAAFCAKTHRVFSIIATHADDPRKRLCTALRKIGCSGLVSVDYDDEQLPFYRFVLVFDGDPSALLARFSRARCAFEFAEITNRSDLNRALVDLAPCWDLRKATQIAERYPAPGRRFGPFGEMLYGRGGVRAGYVAKMTLEDLKRCSPCERGDTSQQREVNRITDDSVMAEQLRMLIRRLRAEPRGVTATTKMARS